MSAAVWQVAELLLEDMFVCQQISSIRGCEIKTPKKGSKIQ